MREKRSFPRADRTVPGFLQRQRWKMKNQTRCFGWGSSLHSCSLHCVPHGFAVNHPQFCHHLTIHVKVKRTHKVRSWMRSLHHLPQLSGRWVGQWTLPEKSSTKAVLVTRATHPWPPWANQAQTLHSMHQTGQKHGFAFAELVLTLFSKKITFNYGTCMLSIFFHPKTTFLLDIWIYTS